MAGPGSISAPAVELRGVSRRYESRWVLRGLQFSIARGERVALVGESGVGKSTLLNLCAGLDPADEGEVLLAGHPLKGLDDDALSALRRRHVGFVFQAFHLVPHLRLWQNVAIPCLLNGLDEEESRARSARRLDALGLGDRLESFPAELSGGEQQRVALARALVHDPMLVLADEPTGNLDPATAARAMSLLLEHSRERGAALLVVTHAEAVARHSDRVMELDVRGLRER